MTKSRRYSTKFLSLLSTAGVAIAPAAMIGATSVLLAPATAMAANECAPAAVDPSVNGSNPDIYTCASGTYNSGITYTADGDLTINGQSSGTLAATAAGVNLTGDSESITWTNTGGTVTGTGAGDSTMVLTTTSGTINLTTNAVTGNSTGMVGAINAETDTGAVNITTSGTINGRQFGILVNHATSGVTMLNVNGGVSINNTDGIAAILVDKDTSSSATTVNVGTGSGTVNGGNLGAAIDLTSGGTQTVTIASGRTVSNASSNTEAVIKFKGSGSRSINNAGTLTAGNSSNHVLWVYGGSSLLLTNSGSMTGALNLSGLTGDATVTNSGSWSAGSMVFNNGGSSTVNNQSGGTWNVSNGVISGLNTLTNSGTFTGNSSTVFSVGAWTNSGTANLNSGDYTATTLTNSGTVSTGSGSGNTTMLDVGTFNNSGTIALGANTLEANNTTFNASGNSLVTVTLGATSGMLDLSGSTVSGVTGIQLNASDTSAFAAPVVVVDVTGGTVAEGDFVLANGSGGLVTSSSGDLFGRTLNFDSDAQQVLAVSAPTTLAMEYVPAMQEALSAWHTTADVVNGRNSDMRTRNRGMWIRIAGDRSERNFMPTVSGVDYDASYSNYTGTAIVGFDVLQGASASGDYYLGLSGGLVRTRMEFDNSGTTDDMDGVAIGVYGGISNGGLTFDGLVNVNLLNLDHNEPINGDTSTNVISIGGRGEVGYVWNLSDAWYVQPIATGAYVMTTIDEVFPGTTEIKYDEVESARAAAGLRIGANAGTVMGPVGFWMTGRLWKEFKDDANVTFKSNGAPDFLFVDDMSDEFQELSAGLTLDTQWANFFVQGGAKFYEADEYDNYNGSVGVRWTW